ncbi:hypothetical protein MRB53_031377 [Persea americana]|uniref:Uncharacterized protein n=1 Tax=Persea americana TaxID=3435 RepID=A0ACC2KP65_PERAE|nr:hypothetical protein MRB53_031377 [Persea americana]
MATQGRTRSAEAWRRKGWCTSAQPVFNSNRRPLYQLREAKKLKSKAPLLHLWFQLLRVLQHNFLEGPPSTWRGNLETPSLPLCKARILKQSNILWCLMLSLLDFSSPLTIMKKFCQLRKNQRTMKAVAMGAKIPFCGGGTC